MPSLISCRISTPTLHFVVSTDRSSPMDRSLLIALIISVAFLVAAFIAARRFLKQTGASADERSVRPSRLTSEHLHRLPPPAWRLVLEIDNPDAPDLEQPVVLPVVHATVALDGRRLRDWVTSLPADVLTPSEVDLAWHGITTGIGRPDPLQS